jgi:hypothetical protein
MREFRDDRGRAYLEAFYSLSGNAPARKNWPLRKEEIREQDLVFQKVMFLSRDEQGRVSRMETYGYLLERTEDIEYDSLGKKAKTTVMWTSSRGDRIYETSFRDRLTTTRLLDQRHRLVTISGDILAEDVPPRGWGEAVGGRALHLAVTPDHGRPVVVRLALTLLDVKERKAATYLAVYPYMELRDSQQRSIPPTAQYAARVVEYRRRLPASNPCDTGAWLSSPNGVWEMQMDEAYGDLPPGPYTLVAGGCVDGSGPISEAEFVVDPPAEQER